MQNTADRRDCCVQMKVGKNASARHISEEGNYGDGREFYASKHIMTTTKANDPDAVIGALEDFDVRWTMLHLGKEKGKYLDRALKDLILERRTKIRALEIGTYLGYSACRIGKILAMEAEGSMLLSVEQNQENAGYAKLHVDHAGLNDSVQVVHSRIENVFKEDGNKISALYDCNRPFDFVFIDHRKAFYLRDLKLLESVGVISATITTVVADNVAPLVHLKNREESILRGKRRGPCKCVNKACDYLDYMRRRWSSTEIFYGENSKDGISVSKPMQCNLATGHVPKSITEE